MSWPSPPSDPGATDPAPAGGEGRRPRILRCAADLFRAQGYHDTKMAEIATAAGIRKTTLYHYFGSKDEILYWLHDEFIEMLIERLEARRDEPQAPAARLRRVGTDVLELMEAHPGYARVYFGQTDDLPGPAREMIASRREHYAGLVGEILSEGIAAGAFRALDVRLSVLAFLGMCNWCSQWFEPGGPERPADVAAHFVEVFVNGVTARPTADPVTASPQPAARPARASHR